MSDGPIDLPRKYTMILRDEIGALDARLRLNSADRRWIQCELAAKKRQLMELTEEARRRR